MWRQFAHWLRSPRPTVQTDFAAIWPVDLHNHLLPGVDDGLTSMEETLFCLRQYADWGIKRVICTPHVSQDYHPNTNDQLQQAVQDVEQAVTEANLPIQIALAAEYLLDETFYEYLERGTLLSFGQQRYVLFETGWVSAPYQLEQSVVLIQLKGYRPVLAHPERYHYYQTEPHHLMTLKEKGCLFQLNLMSLVGQYGKKAQQLAFKLLQTKHINFIGSDLHRPAQLATLESVFTPATIELLEQQPLLNSTLI